MYLLVLNWRVFSNGCRGMYELIVSSRGKGGRGSVRHRHDSRDEDPKIGNAEVGVRSYLKTG